MVAGNVYNQGITTVANGEYFSIQPPVNTEVVIHNITHSTDAELEYFDGTEYVTVDTAIGNGSWQKYQLHCTNTKYYRVKNISASSNKICCDGVQTK